jgi:hypothetical protein
MTRQTITSATVGAVTGDDFMDNVAGHISRFWDASALPLTSVGGTGNAVTATVTPALLSGLVEGMKFTITWAAANTGGVTLALNGGSAVAVLDAAGSALTAGALSAGERALIEFVGSSFRVLGGAAGGSTLGPINEVITASGTWTKPTGYDPETPVLVQAWAAGGSGGRGSQGGSGGGGGAYAEKWFRYGDLLSSYTVTIGAGGAGRTSNGNGSAGGNTSFGSLLTAFGGAGGLALNATGTNDGGGGGGELDAASGSSGGAIGGGSASGSTTARNAQTRDGGGAGGQGSDSSPSVGGDAVNGGGGGGGGGAGGPGGGTAGGRSKYGGSGGAGRDQSGSLSGIDGSVPGGGGGGSEDQLSGAGARGEVRIWIFG